MKNAVYLTLAVLLSACSGTKRAVDQSATRADSSGLSAATDVRTESVVDCTSTESGRLVITEVEFFPTDSTGGAPHRNGITGLSIRDGALSINGISGNPIRAIRQTTVEAAGESRDEIRESRESKEQKQAVSVQKGNTRQTKQVAPAPDPHSGRYVFYLSLVLLAGVLYYKRIPVLRWARKMLCGLVKR